jgi:hypothetical protein
VSERAFHIVITRSRLLLVRRPGDDWRAFQNEHADFMTSLGPYDLDEALEMIGIEWPELLIREREIRAFAAGTAAELDLSS